MRYSDDIIEEVRMKNDIVDVVSQYVKLNKRGSTYFGLCPFHNEKTPSFSVTPAKQMYYCFGCGAGGNVYNFVMQYENYSFGEALSHLAERAGVELPKIEYSKEARAKAEKRAALLEINKKAAQYFYYQLRREGGKNAHDYLTGRGLSEETIRKFGLGYSDKYSDDLYKYLKSQNYSDELLRESGLFNVDERQGMYDKFWNRVIFPIMDVNNRVIGFGGRVMGDGKPKYLNSPETRIFDKSRNLYGLNIARTTRKNYLILCEGYMDVIAMHQAGFTQAVASLGTAFTVEQANLLHRYAENILLAYDSDGAGTKAALRGIGILREAGLTGKVINMRPYKDPDEFIKNLGKEAFQERINQAENSFYFEIRILSEQYDQSDPEQRTKFHREIAQKLCEFSEDLERENYLQAIAEKYMIRPDDLRKMVIGYASQTGIARPIPRPRSGVQNKSDPSESGRKSQRLLITWIGDDPSLYTIVRKYISLEDFTEELYRKVAEKMFAELDNGQFQPAGIISMFEDEEEQRQAAELFHTTLPELSTKQERERAFHDILVSVKRNSYQYYMAQLGTDVNAVKKAVEGKKALEELQRARISLE
mgnify:CR=1 FL=1